MQTSESEEAASAGDADVASPVEAASGGAEQRPAWTKNKAGGGRKAQSGVTSRLRARAHTPNARRRWLAPTEMNGVCS